MGKENFTLSLYQAKVSSIPESLQVTVAVWKELEAEIKTVNRRVNPDDGWGVEMQLWSTV